MILNDVKTRLAQAASELGGRVAQGACANHDEYRHMTGRIRGLQDAMDVIDIMAKEEREGSVDDDDLPEMPSAPKAANVKGRKH